MDAPIDLNLLRTFVLVHESQSFTAAAKQLAVPRSTVSRAISALEDEMGVLLFHRSTRRVTTTRAGSALFDRVQPWLMRLQQSLRDLPSAADAPSGPLRVTVSPDLGAAVLAEAVARYTARYPETRVEVQLTTRAVDLVKEGFDLAIRHTRSPLPGAALVTRKLGNVAFALYASPHYLARRPAPRTLDDLSAHELVVIGSAKSRLPGKPRIVADDKLFARAVVIEGAGIGLLPAYLTSKCLAEGSLVRVLPEYSEATGNVYLVLPSKKHMPSKVAAFRDLLVELFRQRPLNNV